MSPLAGHEISLTKHYNIETLARTIAEFSSGMSESEVRAELPAPHAELADDLFFYDEEGGLIEDTMVRECQAGGPAARLLVWTALLLADSRLQDIVTSDLTTPDGKLDPTAFSKSALARVTQRKLGGAAHEKAASNILQWFTTAGIVLATRHGSSVTGIAEELPTSFAVPKVLDFLNESLPDNVTTAPGRDALVDLATGLGVNHWLNLTAKNFRAAARALPTPPPTHIRADRPPDLDELDAELRRKQQAIIQGPPGVGKTFALRQYVDWFAPPSSEQSRVAAIADGLPEQERVPALIADRIEALGLPAAWEIVQFHPSYSYERFVRGLQPVPVPGGVTFRPVDRLLGTIAGIAKELADRGRDIELLLVIDEINRGDIAKVFGELLFALEYRGEPVSTPYAVEGDPTLVLPTNLFLLGTMNTADQSIAMVDKALRRRFAWITLHPDVAVIDAAPLFVGAGDRAAAKRLFADVAALFDESGPEAARLQVGHSYFLPRAKHATIGESIVAVATQFAFDVWPLLEEYEAEGLLETERLDQLLSSVGWPASGRPKSQGKLAVSVAEYLTTPHQASPAAS